MTVTRDYRTTLLLPVATIIHPLRAIRSQALQDKRLVASVSAWRMLASYDIRALKNRPFGLKSIALAHFNFFHALTLTPLRFKAQDCDQNSMLRPFSSFFLVGPRRNQVPKLILVLILISLQNNIQQQCV